MSSLHKLIALSAAALLAAPFGASAVTAADRHAAHQAVAAAQTAQERQALMVDHMKAMPSAEATGK